jgi:hypothetical protein
MRTLWVGSWCCTHLIDEQTEAQRGDMTQSRPRNCLGEDLNSESPKPMSQVVSDWSISLHLEIHWPIVIWATPIIGNSSWHFRICLSVDGSSGRKAENEALCHCLSGLIRS